MSKVVKSVLLVIHPTRPEAISTAKDLAKVINEKQIKVFQLFKRSVLMNLSNHQIDLAVVLGGDGTMLRAAEIFGAKGTNSWH
jgi:NAD+ kinase